MSLSCTSSAASSGSSRTSVLLMFALLCMSPRFRLGYLAHPPPQLLKAASAGRPDAPHRHIKCGSRCGVARPSRRDEHPQKLLAAYGQLAESAPHVLGAIRVERYLLCFDYHPLGGGLVRLEQVSEGCIIHGDRPPADPDEAQRLTPGRRGEPGANLVRVLDAAQMFGQAKPDGLIDVAGIGRAEAEPAGYSPDEAAEALHEGPPCRFVAVSGRLEQAARIIPLH